MAKSDINILGISAFYHDSAACLLRDGKIVAAAQEERFTRKKHDAAFPFRAIEFCLKEENLSAHDLSLVAFYDKPFLKFERIMETYMSTCPYGIRSFLKAVPMWIKKKLWMKDLIHEKLGYQGQILFPEHHESHGASAFFPSPFQEAAVLTIDGVGEWATASYGTGKGNRLDLLAEIHFPHSIGLLYSAFTYYAGFKVNSGEYKLMGLAPYGEPKFKDLILKELIDLKEDGSFRINLDYFDYCAGLRMINQRFENLFGEPARKAETRLTQHHMDVARSIQDVTEEVMLRMVKHVHKETGMKHLCLAGGVALNCVGNGKILRHGPFEKIWIQPAAGDAGGALGAACIAWYQYLGNPREADGVSDSQYGSFLGPKYERDHIKDFLDKQGISYTEISTAELPSTIADLLAQENVVGWFEGRMEFGPRALGARSILGDARSAKMQETMNLKIKFRESFRPFAPSVTREAVSKYFELEHDSPYMLLVAPLRKELCREMNADEHKLFGLKKLNLVRSELPAITHVDYSARVQTVEKNHNPLFYDTLKAFEKKYGCPVLINTSFNVRGEPIVCTPEDAYRCFMRTNMDFLIIGNFLLEKKNQKPLDKDIDWLKEFELD